MEIEKLLPTAGAGANCAARSLPMRTLDPIGNDTCIIRPFASSGTVGMAGGASPNVPIESNSPPTTFNSLIMESRAPRCQSAPVAFNAECGARPPSTARAAQDPLAG